MQASPIQFTSSPPFNQRFTPKEGVLHLGAPFIDPRLMLENEFLCVLKELSSKNLPAFASVQGYEPLRAQISEILLKRGIRASKDEILITNGSSQALSLIATLMSKGRVASESPAFGGGRAAFALQGISAINLELDPFKGPDLKAWERTIRKERPGLLYLTTRFHNPTSYSYSRVELNAVLEMSRKYKFAILEDDWTSGMTPDPKLPPLLRAVGGDEVLYLGSFAKRLWPAMRLGYVVASRSVIPALAAAKAGSTGALSVLDELVLNEFISAGNLRKYQSQNWPKLRKRYKNCVLLMEKHFPRGVRFTRPNGGLALWVELPRRVDLKAFENDALAEGIELQTANFKQGAVLRNGFRLCFTRLNENEMKRAILTLSRLLRDSDC